MSQINRNDIYDKNLNFLLGSGASYGLLPTLTVKLKNSKTAKNHSIESLATQFEENAIIRATLFSWYVSEIIKPASEFDIDFLRTDEQEKVLENYQRFLSTVLAMISKKYNQKRANIFTTNYDGLIAHVAEKTLQKGSMDFVLNDGGTGFIKRTLNAKNFSRFYRDQGVFDRHSNNVPQINLLQIHGSVYWYKDGENIEISYDLNRARERVSNVPTIKNANFSDLLRDENKTDSDLKTIKAELTDIQIEKFWEMYHQLPIVNPTKWKFHETVFEEHYYQMLRLLSYELEKPDSVFIVFGFSFADEHILNLVKRSLSNPTLKVFICCFSKKTKDEISEKFMGFENVEFIRVDENLDFTAFNEQVFTSEAQTSDSSQ